MPASDCFGLELARVVQVRPGARDIASADSRVVHAKHAWGSCIDRAQGLGFRAYTFWDLLPGGFPRALAAFGDMWGARMRVSDNCEPETEALDPKPQTPNLKPQTPNPKP